MKYSLYENLVGGCSDRRERLNETYDEWSRMIYYDESFLSTVGFHHRAMVIRNSHEVDHPGCIDERDQFGLKGLQSIPPYTQKLLYRANTKRQEVSRSLCNRQ